MRNLIPSIVSRKFFLSLGLLAPFTFIILALAQDPPSPPAAPEQAAATAPIPVIKTESRIVLVDAVVTDKKGNYIHDLSQQDFRVFEDNKEQTITSFSFGSDPTSNPAGGQKRYLVLFFDNSSMGMPDQIQARSAAKKFIEKNASPDRMMAIAEFGGSLRIKQNFTANAELLQAAVTGVQNPNLDTNNKSGDSRGLHQSNRSRGARESRSRFRRAVHASFHSQPRQESSRCTRTQDARGVLCWFSTGRRAHV